MPKENNFAKAVKELLGDKDVTVETTPVKNEDTENKSASTQNKPVNNDNKTNVTSEPKVEKRAPVVTREDVSSPETFINKDTIITGSIVSKTSLRNQGQVTGDITTKEDIMINGKVDGNLDCKNATISNGYVVGNITAKADVCVDCNSIVVGDIVGDNFTSDGKIKGDLKISNALNLSSNAVIFGNVTAKLLMVEDGAVIKGNVQILSAKVTDDETFTIPTEVVKQPEGFHKR